MISCSLIPSKTNTVKPCDVLPIPKLVKHRAAKKIKILIGRNFSNLTVSSGFLHIYQQNLRIFYQEASINKKNSDEIPYMITPREGDVKRLFTV